MVTEGFTEEKETISKAKPHTKSFFFMPNATNLFWMNLSSMVTTMEMIEGGAHGPLG